MQNTKKHKSPIVEATEIRDAALVRAKSFIVEDVSQHLRDMLARKIEEMDSEDEMTLENEDLQFDESKTVTESNISEEAEEESEETLEESAEEESEEADEEESEEESEESAEEEDESGEESEEESAVEDMTASELRDLIRDVVLDALESTGETEGDMDLDSELDVDTEEGEFSTDDMDNVAGEEEIDVTEILSEIQSILESNDEDDMTESYSAEKPINELELDPSAVPAAVGGVIAVLAAAGITSISKEDVKAALSKGGQAIKALGNKIKREKGEGSAPENEAELYETINSLNEIVATDKLLIDKLKRSANIFRRYSLTEAESSKLVNRFEKATSHKEVKMIYENFIDMKKSANPRKNVRSASASNGTAKRGNASTIRENVQPVKSDFVKQLQIRAGILKDTL